jgi:hypothetical protein
MYRHNLIARIAAETGITIEDAARVFLAAHQGLLTLQSPTEIDGKPFNPVITLEPNAPPIERDCARIESPEELLDCIAVSAKVSKEVAGTALALIMTSLVDIVRCAQVTQVFVFSRYKSPTEPGG